MGWSLLASCELFYFCLFSVYFVAEWGQQTKWHEWDEKNLSEMCQCQPETSVYMTPAASLYDKRLMSNRQKRNNKASANQKRGRGLVKPIRWRTHSQVIWYQPQLCTINGWWVTAKKRNNQVWTNQKRGHFLFGEGSLTLRHGHAVLRKLTIRTTFHR